MSEYNKILIIVLFIASLLIVTLTCVRIVNADLLEHKAVIHHTASHDVSAKEIDRWHRERGWNGIGYHFVIRFNGDIERGRSMDKLGAHAKGRNHYVGIVLTGYDVFTEHQKNSLVTLLKDLNIVHIECHHEQCPGKGLDLNEIRKRGEIKQNGE